MTVRHEPCPNCGSRDNLAVWEDGHSYCFGCQKRYWKRDAEMSLQVINTKIQQLNEGDQTHVIVHLPDDSVRTLPSDALSYLKKYGLTQREIYNQNSFFWSDEEESLIYAIYDPNGDLLMYQARYFGIISGHPRFITRGFPEQVCHFIGKVPHDVTLVEDVISAIKVGRHTTAMPLFGSTITDQRLNRLRNLFANINIWLDNDKKSYSVMARQRAAPLFNSARSIISELDPKAYNDQAICEFLAGQSQIEGSRLSDRLEDIL